MDGRADRVIGQRAGLGICPLPGRVARHRRPYWPCARHVLNCPPKINFHSGDVCLTTNVPAPTPWPLVPQKTIRHPNYNPLNQANDIALIVLSEPSFIPPIKLAPASLTLRVGEGLFVAGWGDTEKKTAKGITALS